MLHSFLTANRAQLIDRCRTAAAARAKRDRDELKTNHGIPLFLHQLIETLAAEQTSEISRSRSLSGVAGGGESSEIAETATLHGRELSESGFSLEQVVRDYGDLCQAITNLAFETEAPISVQEFRTLNRCLDNAIAGVVTEFSNKHATSGIQDSFAAVNERLGSLAHEMRNYLHIAMYAVKALKAGNVGITGATGAVLDRSLLGMRNLIDSSLAEVRVTAGLPPRARTIELEELLKDVAAAAALDPRARTVVFTVAPVDAGLTVRADSDMLASAIGNLIQNAFKFTKANTEVTLHAFRKADRVLIEVRDHCGGLPPGPIENLLKPFAQRGNDRSGLGLGLDICRRSVEANNGTIQVRDLPGIGCIFSIDLPFFLETPAQNYDVHVSSSDS